MNTKITILFAYCAWISTLLAQTPDKRLLDRYVLQPSIMHELIETSSPNQTGSSHLFRRAYLPSDSREKFLVSQTLLSENFLGCTIDGQNAEGDVPSNPLSLGTRKSVDRLSFLNEQTYPDTVQAAWIKHYASGLAPSYDNSTAIAVDNQGYIYITGASTKLPFGIDYLTIKYSSTGDTLWTKRYDGSGQGDDIPIAIAVDRSGNVYVTGESKGLGASDDYVTIKYDANGNQLWDALYNGPGNSTDIPTALAIDGTGNVYVTGLSEDSETHFDYVTIKYDASGNQLWVVRYGDPWNNELAGAIALDGSGNVYVSGVVSGVGVLATIKYDTNGNQLWVAQHSGASVLNSDLAVDGYSNVYVTSSSYNSESSFDYVTIKYDANGNQLWDALYNGPGNSTDIPTALAIDGLSNVYVTGTSYNSVTRDDYATIKYDADGNQLWVAQYNGSGNFNNNASSLTVDSSGNVYVSGVSDGSPTYATIKYDTWGNQLWVGLYNGNSTWSSDIAVDDAGNIYVTGGSYGAETYYDYATIKYSASGNQLWVARYNGLGTSLDYPKALAIDGSGNIYVSGHSYGSGAGADYATIKYDDGGNQLWVARYNGPANGDDVATALAIDGTGNVYVTGGITISETDFDYATIKYDANGNQLWVARYNGLANSYDKATALAIDGSGNVYVTGWSEGSGTEFDYATIKYDASGNQLWVARYNEANYHDIPTALAIDGTGNVYVTGWSEGLGTSYDYATIKYDESGNQLWVVRYDAANSYDYAFDLAVDDLGNVYVTGESYETWVDYATIKYDASGNQIWVARYNSNSSFSTDFAIALVLDGSSNVYVTGRSSGSGRYDLDYATIKYNESGNEMWVERYNVTQEHFEEWTTMYSGDYDAARILAVDGTGNVCILARSGGNGWSVYTTIKYIEPPSFVEQISGMPQQYSLEQNYPNPFNPSTTIKYSIPTESIVQIKVYDILGGEVATLVNEEKIAGNYSVQFNTNNLVSGVYFYRIQAGDFIETKKMVLIR